jgi:regulatory protein
VQVTAIEKNGKYKYKVFIDGEYAFWLSWKELYFWKIELNGEISEEQLQKIKKESILEKCKRKAVSYLKFCNQTEQELRTKLKRQLYNEDIIEKTIAYLYDMHYIDDYRYAENFVDVNKKKHSRKWIELRLQQKGIKKDLSDDFFDEEYSEDAPIKKAIEKKLKGASIQTREQREKILASLYRQGFSIYNIKKVLKEYEYND